MKQDNHWKNKWFPLRNHRVLTKPSGRIQIRPKFSHNLKNMSMEPTATQNTAVVARQTAQSGNMISSTSAFPEREEEFGCKAVVGLTLENIFASSLADLHEEGMRTMQLDYHRRGWERVFSQLQCNSSPLATVWTPHQSLLIDFNEETKETTVETLSCDSCGNDIGLDAMYCVNCPTDKPSSLVVDSRCVFCGKCVLSSSICGMQLPSCDGHGTAIAALTAEMQCGLGLVHAFLESTQSSVQGGGVVSTSPDIIMKNRQVVGYITPVLVADVFCFKTSVACRNNVVRKMRFPGVQGLLKLIHGEYRFFASTYDVKSAFGEMRGALLTLGEMNEILEEEKADRDPDTDEDNSGSSESEDENPNDCVRNLSDAQPNEECQTEEDSVDEETRAFLDALESNDTEQGLSANDSQMKWIACIEKLLRYVTLQWSVTTGNDVDSSIRFAIDEMYSILHGADTLADTRESILRMETIRWKNEHVRAVSHSTVRVVTPPLQPLPELLILWNMVCISEGVMHRETMDIQQIKHRTTGTKMIKSELVLNAFDQRGPRKRMRDELVLQAKTTDTSQMQNIKPLLPEICTDLPATTEHMLTCTASRWKRARVIEDDD